MGSVLERSINSTFFHFHSKTNSTVDSTLYHFLKHALPFSKAPTTSSSSSRPCTPDPVRVERLAVIYVHILVERRVQLEPPGQVREQPPVRPSCTPRGRRGPGVGRELDADADATDPRRPRAQAMGMYWSLVFLFLNQ